MARLPKCPECELPVDKSNQEFVKHSNSHYHTSCFTQFETRKKYRQELYDLICHLHKIPKLNGLMLKQIKEYETEYEYTLAGMKMALQYFHYVKNNPVDSKGIGIIPYIYDEAKAYFIQLSKMINHNTATQIDNTKQIIRTSPPKEKQKKMIDLEGIV